VSRQVRVISALAFALAFLSVAYLFVRRRGDVLPSTSSTHQGTSAEDSKSSAEGSGVSGESRILRLTVKVMRDDGVSVGISQVAVRDATGRTELSKTDESGQCSFSPRAFHDGESLEVFAACLKQDRIYWATTRAAVPVTETQDFEALISYSPGIRIRGTLLTSAGSPLGNSEVWISAWPRVPFGSPELALFQKLIVGAPELRIPTDELGLFQVDHLPAEFRFAFRKDPIRGGGGVPLEVETTLAKDFSAWFYAANPGVFEVRLTQVAPPRVRIVIKDAAGGPLSDASVGFIAEVANDGVVTPSRRGVRKTSADGSVEFEVPLIAGQAYASLAGRRFWFVVRHEKWGICYGSGSLILPQTTQEVRFDSAGGPHWVKVRFVDAASGNPIVGMTVKLASLASGGNLASAKTDDNGLVEFNGIGEPGANWSSSGAYPDHFEVRVTQDAAELAKVVGDAVKSGAGAEEIERITRAEFPLDLDRECEIRLRSRE